MLMSEASGRRWYAALRGRGENDLATILLDISSELMVFDFGPTYTNAFEVLPAIPISILASH